MDSAPGAHWRVLCVAKARTAAALGRGWVPLGTACFWPHYWRGSGLARPTWVLQIERQKTDAAGSADEASSTLQASCTLQVAGRFHKSSPRHRFSFSSDLSDGVALASLQACGFRSKKSVMTPNACPHFAYSIDISLH